MFPPNDAWFYGVCDAMTDLKTEAEAAAAAGDRERAEWLTWEYEERARKLGDALCGEGF